MNDIDNLAKIIWDYMRLGQPFKKSDLILVLGSIDEHSAEYGAKLFLEGRGKLLVISGGVAHKGDLLTTDWDKPEAEQFANIAMRMGVPIDKIILETQATNTGENARYTYELLEKKGLLPKSMIVVQKPYMERRTYATFKKQWRDSAAKIVVTSSPFGYEDYFKAGGGAPKNTVINIMVGDLQRIKEYPKLGYQIEQAIPPKVWQAYEKLVELGFNKHLIRN